MQDDYSELIKDADILCCYLLEDELPKSPKLKRLEKVKKELNL